MAQKYFFLDSGSGEKLEQLGTFRLARPAPLAIWPKQLSPEAWQKADAVFSREEEGGKWHFPRPLPPSWEVEMGSLVFKASLTPFGHFGFFPEHLFLSDLLLPKVKAGLAVLNLFAYTGAATLAFAQKGARVCHLDASKSSVAWARENAFLNHLEKAPVRWIVDDVFKFLKRELKRGQLYDGILLDPPSFGRGTRQEVFKIETAILPLLDLCQKLLSPQAVFLAFSCHTPGFSKAVLENLLAPLKKQRGGQIFSGELFLPRSLQGPELLPLPSGTYGVWEAGC
ncbi:MAG: class I SAM-dependent methyltransferase [Parachlamydiales bacterium]|jgi:23S rRNA (cytosine1962-C5)-methyltransferase